MTTILCALAIAAGLQEKVTLRYQPKEGDSVTLNATVTMNLKVKTDGGEQEFQAVNNRLATVEIGAVADGRPTRKTVEYLSDTDEQTAGGRTERRENPLHGKRVTGARKDGKWTFACEEKLDEETLRKAGDDEKFTQLLPGREVAVGESWTLSGDKLSDAWAASGGLEGEMKMTLKDLKEIDGKRCATIAMKWDVKSPKAPDGTQHLLKVDGEIIATLDRGHISIVGRGPMTIRRGEAEVATGTVSYMLVQALQEK